MREDAMLTRMNIAHYGGKWKLSLDDEKHSALKRLLAEAKEHLVLATAERDRNSIPTF